VTVTVKQRGDILGRPKRQIQVCTSLAAAQIHVLLKSMSHNPWLNVPWKNSTWREGLYLLLNVFGEQLRGTYCLDIFEQGNQSTDCTLNISETEEVEVYFHTRFCKCHLWSQAPRSLLSTSHNFYIEESIGKTQRSSEFGNGNGMMQL